MQARPVLSLGFAWKLFVGGEREAGAALLRNAERWLDALAGAGGGPDAPAAEPIVVNKAELPSLAGSVAGAWAFYAQATGDVTGTVAYARQALELLPPDDHVQRGMAGAMLGLAHWTRGELETAHRLIRESSAELRKTGDVSTVIASASTLADIRATQGRLDEAIRIYERALQVAAEHGDAMVEGTADLYLGLSEMHLERNEVEKSRELLRRSQDLGDGAAFEAYEYRSRVLRGRLAQAQGDLEGAVDLLSEADRINTGGPIPDLRPAGALRARAWIALGRIAEAMDWARERGLSPRDDLSYLREFEHITLARVLIAESERQGTADSGEAALRLLERLRDAAEDGGRIRSAIHILVLQAVAHDARRETPLGLAALECAMTLAEPQDYVQIFVDERSSLGDLLRRAAAGEVAGAFARRLLEAIGDPGGETGKKATTTGGLLEPLTARETEILRLIAAGLRNQEIADQLVISIATVKRHIANAYGKLGVGHRTEAAARARAGSALARLSVTGATARPSLRRHCTPGIHPRLHLSDEGRCRVAAEDGLLASVPRRGVVKEGSNATGRIDSNDAPRRPRGRSRCRTGKSRGATARDYHRRWGGGGTPAPDGEGASPAALPDHARSRERARTSSTCARDRG